MRFTLYTKDNCPLCDEAVSVLQRVREELPFEWDVVDITHDRDLTERYGDLVPVLALQHEDLFYGKISAHRLKQILRSSRKTSDPNESVLSPRYRAFLDRLRQIMMRQSKSRDNCP